MKPMMNVDEISPLNRNDVCRVFQLATDHRGRETGFAYASAEA